MLRVADRAERRDTGDMPQAAVIVRDRRVDAAEDRHAARRLHDTDRRIGGTRRLRRAAGVVDRNVVFADRDRRANVDIGVALAIAVHPGFADEGALRHGADLLAHAPIGIVVDRVDIVRDLIRAIFGNHLLEAPPAIPDRTELRHQIAIELIAVSDIGEIQPDDVVSRLTLLVELEGRDGEALLEDVARGGGCAGGDERADVELMALGHAPEHVAALVEHRAGRDHIADMRVTAIGVVADDDIAVMNVVLKDALHLLQHDMQRVGVNRNSVRHAHLTPFAIEDRAGEVAHQCEDGGPRGVFERQCHFARDRAETVEQHREGDRIDRGSDIMRFVCKAL